VTSRRVDAIERAPVIPGDPHLSPGARRVSGFARRVAECNEVTAEDMRSSFVPFVVGGRSVGLMQPWFAARLAREGGDLFTLCRETRAGEAACITTTVAEDEIEKAVANPEKLLKAKVSLVLRDFDHDAPETRTRAVRSVLEKLRDEGVITGWRDELFPVVCEYGDAPLFFVERAAAGFLGVRAFGAHVHGYVADPATGRPEKLWIARRSETKPTFPGMLDHLVAGGLPAKCSPMACVIKECAEEASIPPALASTAVSSGIVTYVSKHEGNCKRDAIFCYDLRLPETFVPTPNDGEVESFFLVHLEEACRLVAETNEFKPNVAVALVDFFIRHGWVTPEDPGYAELAKSLKRW